WRRRASAAARGSAASAARGPPCARRPDAARRGVSRRAANGNGLKHERSPSNIPTIESPAPSRTIAVRVREGKGQNLGPGLVWLGGFKSDMKGTKAEALDRWAAAEGRACLRFDYSGHGESSGDFRDGTIGR